MHSYCVHKWPWAQVSSYEVNACQQAYLKKRILCASVRVCVHVSCIFNCCNMHILIAKTVRLSSSTEGRLWCIIPGLNGSNWVNCSFVLTATSAALASRHLVRVCPGWVYPFDALLLPHCGFMASYMGAQLLPRTWDLIDGLDALDAPATPTVGLGLLCQCVCVCEAM